jgi:tetratricopeptide (TPR) repeat protein
VLEQAIVRTPLVSYVYLDYGEFLWRHGDRAGAMEQARHALQLDVGLEAAWGRLCEWGAQLDRFKEVLQLARQWTVDRPGEARSWIRLGWALSRQGQMPTADAEKQRQSEYLAAFDQALKLNPVAREIHDLKAEALALAGRHAEARAACTAPVWKGHAPLILRGRAAWVKAVEGDFDTAKTEMVKILKEDPNYHWGWNQLADWCFTSGEYKEYLDAANEMLRLNPHSAQALAYRGEARLRMGEREAGMEDLRAANRKDPLYGMPAYLLFDEQIADRNLAGAEATLLSLQQNIGGDHVRSRQVLYHTRSHAERAIEEDKKIALETFRSMCAAKATQSAALDFAMRALDAAGWKEPAEAILLEAMRAEDWNTHLAVLYAERWNPNLTNDLPDRVAALDRALAKQPETCRFLDMKAHLLATAGQFDRALAVCRSQTFPLDRHLLDGRGIWVEYLAGKKQEAIESMRDLLRRHPKYLWGWSQLADWYHRQQSWVDMLTVAEQLLLLAPKDAVAFYQRALAKQNLGDPEAARTDYARALDLAPGYVWAGWNLYDLHMRAGEWRRAEKVLEKVEKFADPAELAQRKVFLLACQNKRVQFPAEMENLCRNSSKTPWLVDQTVQWLAQQGWWPDAEPILHKCLEAGPHICDPWVRLQFQTGTGNIGNVIRRMSPSRPERNNCVAAYAIELAYGKQPSGLREWIQANADSLHSDTANWARVAFALQVVQDWSTLAEWMSDWQAHTQARPSQLMPMVRACRSLGRVEAARKVSLHALTKLTPDFANAFHKVWLVFDQALAGDLQAIQKYLDQEYLAGLDGYHRMIAYMIRALAMTLSNPSEGFAPARRFLAEAASGCEPIQHDPALEQAYQQSLGLMAQTNGTLAARLWRWWRWMQPILPPVQKQA